MQDGLFDTADATLTPERVLMSLNPEYYKLIWQRLKRHEFRRRFLQGRPTTWYVYLTTPLSTLAAVIDLDEAIVDTPRSIADLAEQARVGNGASVFEYLQDLKRGFALPIKNVREYAGFTADELADMLGGFHPPQGYILIDKHPTWAGVCDKLISTDVVRELVVEHPAPIT
ncbi:hypothetical protein [Saccharopolyspora sp. ASAGF58]|uniref:hypothetical protein n=1 Tax=Saccharopolyspora sp. ASAGF58 TaxID=2719023 RepID=UPI00143FD70F|nr:hypothetical protein [Saccharopolyspora sp. ASAGF58]QIZ37238.1 hypothetical protein FDZ84_24700 [Saccharopolyspora sp. ASAGF58]